LLTFLLAGGTVAKQWPLGVNNMKAADFCVKGCITLALLVSSGSAWTEPLAATRLAPVEIKWEEKDQSGVQRAFLVGDEKKPGMYTYRVRFPANHKVQPHFHPDERIVTVISGTLYVGYGEQFDESAMKALPTGSIWTEPAKQPHFVFAKEGEVVFQVVGANGPSGLTRIEQK
jgi:quercetin dioxygenase-like cupin family protein